ncbi:MAG: phytanoyl-CoA dioxygenase family protein [Burkholderiaceae bacterium]
MKLTQEQLDRFESEGYLFFPSLFTPEEIGRIRDEVPSLYSEDRPEVFREKDGKTPRTGFASHTYNEMFARLGRHPRMVNPVEQLLGESVYMHQYKVNGKQAFDGDVWQWHQDFGTWHRDDGMPEPRAMNVAVFLDEVNEFNGPLYFIPGSHREGVVEAGHDVSTTSYPLWTLDNKKVTELVDQGGIVAPKGPAGSMLIFHGCLVHGSPPNMTPWNRVIIYLSLCAVSNHITKFNRPDFIAHRDFTPVRKLQDDCLLRDDVNALPWPVGGTV